jgi:DNA repair photolyase
LQVLIDFSNPASITTKGVLVKRDADLLGRLSEIAEVSVNFSIGTVDEEVWKLTEPGAPSPQARLDAMQHLVENGINAGVMMAPLLPGISDHEENIAAVAEAAHNHGAQFLGSNVLFLKPGSKEWFMPMLRETYPHLEQAYAKLYRKTYAPEEYTRSVLSIVDRERHRWGLNRRERDPAPKPVRGQLQFSLAEEAPRRRRKATPVATAPQAGQLELALTA